MTVYTLLNWLPSLMVAKGLSRYAAAQSSIFLNIGAAVGSLLLGRIADRTEVAKMIVAIYIGMGIALACLILASGPALQLAALVVGFFVIGGQLILYSLPPLLYPRTESGKGIGAAIAVGRIGSILGPITAGFILSSDLGPNAVAFFAEIGLAIALTVALRLSLRARLGKCA
jgi:AAHS family 3-hydroxyphenylpropionic acid transporter